MKRAVPYPPLPQRKPRSPQAGFSLFRSDCEPVHICSAWGLLNLTALGI